MESYPSVSADGPEISYILAGWLSGRKSGKSQDKLQPMSISQIFHSPLTLIMKYSGSGYRIYKRSSCCWRNCRPSNKMNQQMTHRTQKHRQPYSGFQRVMTAAFLLLPLSHANSSVSGPGPDHTREWIMGNVVLR